MLSQVERQVHARLGHVPPTRAEEFWRERQRLDLRGFLQCLDQFGREHIAAGFAGDEHQGLELHGWSSPSWLIWVLHFLQSAW